MHHTTNTTHETQSTVSRILYRIRQTGAVDRIRILAQAIDDKEPAIQHTLPVKKSSRQWLTLRFETQCRQVINIINYRKKYNNKKTKMLALLFK